METIPAVSATAMAGKSSGLAFQVRGSLQTMLCLRLLRPNDGDFFESLLAKVAHNPEFFRNAPMVLDVGALQDADANTLEALIDGLRNQKLAPVGLQNGSDAWNEEAMRLDLAVFAAGGEPKAPPAKRAAEPAARAAPVAEHIQTMVIKDQIRGGQQLMSKGDLVIMSSVSPGAEIAAAGHIHVYGTLRGRAFAGVNGDEQAMIFCDQMHADLVSIAGIHAVNEDIDERLLGKRVRVSCKGERLQMQPLP